MGTFRIAAVLFLLLAVPPAGRAEVSSDGARQLAQTVDAALAGAAQAAKDARNPRLAPFRSALQALRARVSRIEGSLAPPTEELFVLVDEGSADLGALRVAWARAGVKNDRVAEEIRIASTSYRRLRADFGREGLRQRQGGPLSDAEKRRLQRLQRAERRFAENARLLRDRARRRGDAATAAELERFRVEAQRIAQASANLATYLNARIAAAEVKGEWRANAPYIRKAVPRAQWAAADQTVQDLSVDADIGQVFTADLGTTPADGAETAAEPEAASPGEAQVYQLSEPSTELPVVEPVAVSAGEVSEPADPDPDPDAEPVQDIDLSAPGEPVAGSEAPSAKPAESPAAGLPIPPPIG